MGKNGKVKGLMTKLTKETRRGRSTEVSQSVLSVVEEGKCNFIFLLTMRAKALKISPIL